MATIWNITADSVPVLDEWGWSDYWGVQEWIQWYKAVKAKHGKVYADTLFKIYWNKQDLDANPYNWAKYDSDFRAFLASEGLLSSVSNVVADVVSAGTEVISTTAGTASDVVSDVSSGVASTAKLSKYLLPAIFVAILVVVFLSFRKRVA
jgi:hypothetical protein